MSTSIIINILNKFKIHHDRTMMMYLSAVTETRSSQYGIIVIQLAINKGLDHSPQSNAGLAEA